MPCTLRDFSASLEQLPAMVSYIIEEAEKRHLDPKQIHRIELACEEALVNIISYGYAQSQGSISIACDKIGDRFQIILKDQGIAFNPIEAPIAPQVEASIQDRKIGGLGIYLIRKTIDEASYQHIDNQNILRLVFDSKRE